MKFSPYFALICASILVSCENIDSPVIQETGTIINVKIEGGFYGIVSVGGVHYQPTNLPPEFKTDSLRVIFQGVITDEGTIQMWGRSIKLVSIKLLDK